MEGPFVADHWDQSNPVILPPWRRWHNRCWSIIHCTPGILLLGRRSGGKVCVLWYQTARIRILAVPSACCVSLGSCRPVLCLSLRVLCLNWRWTALLIVSVVSVELFWASHRAVGAKLLHLRTPLPLFDRCLTQLFIYLKKGPLSRSVFELKIKIKRVLVFLLHGRFMSTAPFPTLALGHMRCHLMGVLPQSNSPPGAVPSGNPPRQLKVLFFFFLKTLCATTKDPA